MAIKRVSEITSQARVSRPSLAAAEEPSVLTAAKGGGIIFVGTLFDYGMRFVIGIVLARSLGSEQFGLYSLALTVATLAGGVALLGLVSALVRYISLFVSQGDAERVWGTLQIGIGLPMVLSVLMAIGVYAGAGPIAERLFHEPRLASLFRLVSLMIPLLTLLNVAAAATRGFKKMQYTAIAQHISRPAIKLVLLAMLVITGLTAAKALAAHVLSVLIASVMLLYFLNSLFPLKRSPRTARRDGWEIFKFTLPIYFSYLIRTFRKNIQTLFLGALHTIASVGVFTVVSQVNLVGTMFHDSIVTSSMPIVSELHGRGERERLAGFYQTMTKWTFTLNLPLFLIVLSFPGPILSVFGEDFVEGALALIILACGSLIDVGTGICGVVLNMTGHTPMSLLNTIVLSFLTVALNLLLIPRWGLTGAAVAAFASTGVVNLMRLLEVLFLLRLVPYNVRFVKPIVAGLAGLAVAWVTRHLFHVEAHLVFVAINMVVLLAVYLGMLLLLGLSDEDRLVLSRIGKSLGIKLLK